MAKLLFITQKVDKDDDVLGAYHEWIAGLTEKFEKISVICLYRGRMNLPDNVSVYSLGKESGQSRLKYIWRFYKYIWSLRRDYDAVFVHMNPEYVLLGWKLWRLWGKRIFLWYNHPMGDWKARWAIAFSDAVFHTSPFAFAAKYKKSILMPVGIDTDSFRRMAEIKRKPRSILYLGRVSPIKKIEVLVEAAKILQSRGLDFSVSIVGAPSKPSEEDYFVKIKKMAEPLIKSGHIEFLPPVPNYKTPEVYSSYELSVNMTPTGSFDKAIIESMACETPVIASNKSVGDILPPELIFDEDNAKDFAGKIDRFFKSTFEERSKIGQKSRQIVIEKHNLSSLIDKLSSTING